MVVRSNLSVYDLLIYEALAAVDRLDEFEEFREEAKALITRKFHENYKEGKLNGRD